MQLQPAQGMATAAAPPWVATPATAQLDVCAALSGDHSDVDKAAACQQAAGTAGVRRLRQLYSRR
jgi:hypothetical protein